MSWNEIKFFESTQNLKKTIKGSTGKSLSTSVAYEIASSIKQGRLFCQAAKTSPLEIRPLLIYYGYFAFATAIASARTCKSITTFKQSHGLKEISSHTSVLASLRAKVLNEGIFTEFNNCISPLESWSNICGNVWRDVFVPTASSKDIQNFKISLKDILSRSINTEVQRLYKNTFDSQIQSFETSLIRYASHPAISIFIKIPAYNVIDAERILRQLCKVCPVFDDLCLWEMRCAPGAEFSSLVFNNLNFADKNELGVELEVYEGNGLGVTRDKTPDLQITSPRKVEDILSKLPPVSGGIERVGNKYIYPYNDQIISDASLKFIGCFLLSSLARYRPNIWMHSLTSRATETNKADDCALAIIEAFLDDVLNTLPTFVTNTLKVRIST